jgi:FMN reductase
MNPDGPVVTIVANPGGPGRTGAAARGVADRVAGLRAAAVAADAAAATTDGPDVVEIDLAQEPERLLAWGSLLAGMHRATIAGGSALVVATPTYKASFTGLLKIFLDQIDAGELAGIPTVALMTGGSDAHALAVDVHLAPVLLELGASLPVRGLYLSGPAVDEPGPAIDAWWATAAAPLTRALGG